MTVRIQRSVPVPQPTSIKSIEWKSAFGSIFTVTQDISDDGLIRIKSYEDVYLMYKREWPEFRAAMDELIGIKT